MVPGNIFYYIIGLLLLLVLGRILVWPLKKILKFIGNGILGGLALLIFNFLGNYFGFSALNIAITPLNAIVVGFLGVPGVVLLLILQVVL